MKAVVSAACLAVLFISSSPPATADFGHAAGALPDPAGHAPAGVMFEHMHKAHEWMIGYRFIRSAESGLFHGSREITVAELQAAGYSGIPADMSMNMHMLDIMYAPTDNLNLMVMPQWMSMDMTMNVTAGEHGDDHGHDHGGAAGYHQHATSGLGDTVVAALVRLHQGTNHSLHMGLGFSVPTGSVVELDANGRAVHYGMQLGSGTWDALPSLTYTGRSHELSWGAQIGGTFRMQSRNNSGFSFGDQQQISGWTALRLAEWVSTSVRIRYAREGGMTGHYSGPHNHSSPGDLQQNYGGESWELGLGFNAVIPAGPLARHRLGLEWLSPVHEHYRGYQLGSDHTLVFNWSAAL